MFQKEIQQLHEKNFSVDGPNSVILRVSSISEVEGHVLIIFDDGEESLPCCVSASCVSSELVIGTLVRITQMKFSSELQVPMVLACNRASTRPPTPEKAIENEQDVATGEMLSARSNHTSPRRSRTPSPSPVPRISKWEKHFSHVVYPKVGSLESNREGNLISVCERMQSNTIGATTALRALRESARGNGNGIHSLLTPTEKLCHSLSNLCASLDEFKLEVEAMLNLCSEQKDKEKRVSKFVDPTKKLTQGQIGQKKQTPSNLRTASALNPSTEQPPIPPPPITKPVHVTGGNVVSAGKGAPTFLRSSISIPDDVTPSALSNHILRAKLLSSTHVGPRQGPALWSSPEDIVYACGNIVVVQNVWTKEQHLFCGHTETVQCLAQHPKCRYLFASVQQNEPLKKNGILLVWDANWTTGISEVSRIEDGVTRGAQCLTFSQDGIILAVLTSDHNKLVLFNWAQKSLLSSIQTSLNPIHAVQFNPFSADSLITVGVNHMRYHSITRSLDNDVEGVIHAKVTDSRAAVIGAEKSEVVTSNCVAFCSMTKVVTGTREGNLFVFENGTRVDVIRGAHSSSINCLHYCATFHVLVSASKTGEVKLWAPDGDSLVLINTIELGEWNDTQNRRKGSAVPGDAYEDATPIDTSFEIMSLTHPEVIHLHSCSETGTLAVTTTQGVYIVEDATTSTPQVKIVQESHQNELRDTAVNVSSRLVATLADDGLMIWSILDSGNLNLLLKFDVGLKPRCLGFANNGLNLLAVGTCDSVKLYKLESGLSLGEIHNVPVSGDVSHVSFSPENGLIAVGCKNTNVDIYNVSTMSKVSTCKTQSSGGVRTLDWSSDGSVVHIYTHRNEILYFLATKGQQIVNTKQIKDLQFHSWTAPVGWPVLGLWQDGHYTSSAEVTSLCVNPTKSWILIGEATGRITTSQFPSLSGRIRRFKHKAHTGPTKVMFVDEHTAVTLGMTDRALHVWSLTCVAATTLK